jgi:hypothetical protein
MEVHLQGDSYKAPSSSETTTNVWTTVDGDNVVMHTQARKFILSGDQAEQLSMYLAACVLDVRRKKNASN